MEDVLAGLVVLAGVVEEEGADSTLGRQDLSPSLTVTYAKGKRRSVWVV